MPDIPGGKKMEMIESFIYFCTTCPNSYFSCQVEVMARCEDCGFLLEVEEIE